MFRLSANQNYYNLTVMYIFFKGIFRLCESIRDKLSLNPNNAFNNRKIVKIFNYEHCFYVLYKKHFVMKKFKRPVFDEVSKCYRIQWSDMAHLTKSIVTDRMYVTKCMINHLFSIK